jgi:hypothetical protein
MADDAPKVKRRAKRRAGVRRPAGAAALLRAWRDLERATTRAVRQARREAERRLAALS